MSDNAPTGSVVQPLETSEEETEELAGPELLAFRVLESVEDLVTEKSETNGGVLAERIHGLHEQIVRLIGELKESSKSNSAQHQEIKDRLSEHSVRIALLEGAAKRQWWLIGTFAVAVVAEIVTQVFGS